MYKCIIAKMYIESLLIAAADPMEILNGRDMTGGETPLIKANRILGFSDLFAILQRDAVLIAVISIIATLIAMLFVKKEEKLAEMKKSIGHKLLIVFIISSLLSILNLAIKLLNYVF